MDVDIISGTASAGTIGMPVGAPLGLKLLIPTNTVFDLTSKYVEIRLRQEGGTGPILYTATTDGSYGSITDGGTADQYVEFNIPTATVSEHDSATTLASLAKAGRKYDFAVDIKTSAASDTALRVQGELHWIVAEGEYSTSATTGSSLTVNVSSGSATVTLSVAAAGAQGPQGEKGDKGDTGDSGSGTVSSVAISGSDGIEVDSGSPITTTGTIALGVDAAALRTHINVEDGADVTDTTNVGSAINGATGKTTPVDADSVGLIDSAASNVLKKLTWANIKATLKTYFDTVYAAALGADENYVTDAEKVVIGNTSGTNTGDQDLSTYQLKPSEGAFVDGDKTKLDGLGGLAGGTTGQIATKASGDDYDLAWSDDLTVPGLLTADHIHGNLAGTLYIHVKNTSGGALDKGTPVYVTGHVGSSDRVEVAAADSSDPAKMPAIALLAQDLGINGEGDGVIVGEIRTYDTDSPGWALNDEIFVGTSGLTTTRPTTGSVQPVATVGRIQASTGVLVINCQGQRTPDESFADATHTHTLSDITDAGTAAANDTGDFEASGAVSTHAAITSGVHGISTFGASLVDDTDAATARTTLGLGTAATSAAVDFATAAQGALADSAVQPGDNVSDLTNDSGFISSVEGTAVLSTGETGGSKFLREDGDGTCSWQTIAGGGDMLASTYDPGSVSEQVVGLTATQTLTNKTLTTPTITLKQGTAPAPTAEGDIQWDTDDNQIKVGDGAATKVFSDDSQLATAAQGALADSAQQPPVEGAFVDGDKTKLDGIEAGADVTDTANVTAAGALMDSEVTNLAQVKAFDSSDYMPIAEPYYLQAALSVNGEAISAGTFKGFARVPKSGNITDVTIDCDPNNEPSAAAVQVDCNTVNRSTGAATSVLSAVASIATSGNTGSGTVNGTQAVSAGDLLSFDIDQGSDGKDLIVTVEITPT